MTFAPRVRKKRSDSKIKPRATSSAPEPGSTKSMAIVPSDWQNEKGGLDSTGSSGPKPE
jgi:hypothetical protein